MNATGKLFVTGLTLGWGPCLGGCLPVLLPYIGGAGKGWKRGAVISLVFSVSRLCACTVLGFLAGYSARFLLQSFFMEKISHYFRVAGSLLIMLLGALIVLGPGPAVAPSFCGFRRQVIEKGMKGIALLGFLIGLAPCVPLLGVLAFIMLEAENGLQGLLYGFSFGAGTFLSPLILLGTLAGGAVLSLSRFGRLSNFISRSCGALLVVWGLQILLRLF